MKRPLSTMALFVALLVSWMSLGLADDPGINPPTATAKCGPVGNPPQTGSVRVDGTWDYCPSDSSKAETVLWKKGNPPTKVKTFSAEPAGTKGSLGGDVSDPTKMQKGDVVYAVTKVYDKNGQVVAQKQSDDYTVP